MKYLLTLASLVVFASSANAVCPLQASMKQHSTLEQEQVLASQDQSESGETELTDLELLLLLKKTQQLTYN